MGVLKQGQLKGAFRGFKNLDTTFEFYGGGIWRQNEHKYLYHYGYMPHAQVIQEGGRYMIYVDGVGEPVEVKRLK